MNNDRAFPQFDFDFDANMNTSSVYNISGGLTKRELFAAMAMQGQLANSSNPLGLDELAKVSRASADALIAELKKTQQPQNGEAES